MTLNLFRSLVGACAIIFSTLPSVYGQALSNDELHLKANILRPSCVLQNDPIGDEFSFGLLNPGSIAAMPLSNDDNVLNYILTRSALGDFKTIYAQKKFGLTLTVHCPGMLLSNDVERMSLTFGRVDQVAQGTLGVASQGYAFELNSQSLANILAIIMHVNDVFANPNGQNGLIKPGLPFPLVNGQSFQDDAGNGYIAKFQVTPGLFWSGQGYVAGDASFSLEIPVLLTYN